jgi:hypothetical protein
MNILDHVIAGGKVVTSEGFDVHVSQIEKNSFYPIKGYVLDDLSTEITQWTAEGKYYQYHESIYDLVPIKIKSFKEKVLKELKRMRKKNVLEFNVGLDIAIDLIKDMKE